MHSKAWHARTSCWRPTRTGRTGTTCASGRPGGGKKTSTPEAKPRTRKSRWRARRTRKTRTPSIGWPSLLHWRTPPAPATGAHQKCCAMTTKKRSEKNCNRFSTRRVAFNSTAKCSARNWPRWRIRLAFCLPYIWHASGLHGLYLACMRPAWLMSLSRLFLCLHLLIMSPFLCIGFLHRLHLFRFLSYGLSRPASLMIEHACLFVVRQRLALTSRLSGAVSEVSCCRPETIIGKRSGRSRNQLDAQQIKGFGNDVVASICLRNSFAFSTSAYAGHRQAKATNDTTLHSVCQSFITAGVPAVKATQGDLDSVSCMLTSDIGLLVAKDVKATSCSYAFEKLLKVNMLSVSGIYG